MTEDKKPDTAAALQAQLTKLDLSSVIAELTLWIEEHPYPKPTLEKAAIQALEKWADWRRAARG